MPPVSIHSTMGNAGLASLTGGAVAALLYHSSRRSPPCTGVPGMSKSVPYIALYEIVMQYHTEMVCWVPGKSPAWAKEMYTINILIFILELVLLKLSLLSEKRAASINLRNVPGIIVPEQNTCRYGRKMQNELSNG